MKYCKLPGLPDDLNCNQWLKDKNVPSIRFCKDLNAKKKTQWILILSRMYGTQRP